MIVLQDVAFIGDGRVLILGMDPTLTLCAMCHEIIAPDYDVVNVHMEVGRLVHVRCLPTMEFEKELLPERRFHDGS